jgi:hypothetical protein
MCLGVMLASHTLVQMQARVLRGAYAVRDVLSFSFDNYFSWNNPYNLADNTCGVSQFSWTPGNSLTFTVSSKHQFTFHWSFLINRFSDADLIHGTFLYDDNGATVGVYLDGQPQQKVNLYLPGHVRCDNVTISIGVDPATKHNLTIVNEGTSQTWMYIRDIS